MKKTMAALLALVFAFSLWGEENRIAGPEKPAKAEPAGESADIVVTVTASRSEKETIYVPAQVTVITSGQLENRSVPEALSLFAGIDMRSFNGSEASLQPSSRGFTENGQGRVLILFDGIRLNNPDMSSFNWQSLPGGRIERIEVLRGSASSLYGDYAVASVINIIPEKPAEGVSFDYSLGTGSGSLVKNSVNASAGGEKLSVAVSATDSVSEGWRKRTGTRSTTFSASAAAEINEKLKTSFYMSYGNEMNELPGSLTKDQYDDDPREAYNLQDEASSENMLLQVSGSWKISDRLETGLDAGYRTRKSETDMASWFSYTDTTLGSLSLNPFLTAGFPEFMHGASLTGGADLVFDNLEVKRHSDVTRESKTYDGKAGKQGAGVYSRGEFFLTESLVLALSGRADMAGYSCDLDDADDEKRHGQFSWGAGINYIAGDYGKIYIRYEKLFRYPFLDEQIVYSGYGSDGMTEGLDPEKGHSFDAGFELSGGKYASGGTNMFLMLMDDEITYNNDTGMNENMSGTLRYGLESSLVLRPVSFFSISGSHAFTIAEFDRGENDGKTVPLSPMNRFSVMPELSLFSCIRLYSEAVYSGDYYQGGDNSNSLGRVDGVFLVNAGADLTADTRHGTVRFYGRARNIADVKYAALVYSGGYYPGSGRELEFGIAYSY